MGLKVNPWLALLSRLLFIKFLGLLGQSIPHWVANMTDMYWRTVLEARSLKSRCQQSWLLLGTVKGNLSHPLSEVLVVSDGSLAYSPLPSSSHNILPAHGCVQTSSFKKNTSHIGLGAHTTPGWPLLNSMWTENFQMFKMDLEKAEEPEIKLSSPLDHTKSKRIPENHLLLLYWLHQSLCLCGSQQTVENSERDGNTRPPYLPLRNLYAGQEEAVRTGHGPIELFKIGKGVLSPCLFNLYAEYITWNARPDEAQAEIKIAGRNINKLRYADDIMAESKEERKFLLMKVEEESEKVGLKLSTQKTKFHHFMANRWGDNGNSERLYFLGLQSHCRWWLQPWN